MLSKALSSLNKKRREWLQHRRTPLFSQHPRRQTQVHKQKSICNIHSSRPSHKQVEMQALRDCFAFDIGQRHRLFTHEDSKYFNLHKIFGTLCLANFVYRTVLFFTYKTTLLDDGSWQSLAWIGVHAALHLSSFEFILNTKRNKTYNVIWPEMRWHSMIFAYRSIAAMVLLWGARNNLIASARIVFYARAAIVICTMLAADLVTRIYKQKNIVDAADSTMRGNPYPQYVPTMWRKFQNLFYSTSQVFGTIAILCLGFDSIFVLLVPIQLAPFLMTLEKKGFITQAGWHFWYTLTILVGYAYNIMMPQDDMHYFKWGAAVFFCTARFALNTNKYILWGVVIATQAMLYTHVKSDDGVYVCA